MNNNRNQNRRRGRGQNRQQGGGGQQLNRIDSRARGNAPQLLEKYKKLAHDSHLNGDRVQAEYYLQFADHYFRVIADARTRQEEQRRPRDERFGDGSYEESDEAELAGENEMPGFDPPYRREESQREPRREERGEFRDSDERPPRLERFEEPQPPEEAPPEAAEAAESGADFEPTSANPFTRDNRAVRGLRPRRERPVRPSLEGEDGDEGELGLDPSLLPPAISEAREPIADADAEETPAPRRRGRPRKPAPDDDAGPLEAVNG
ncbi:MAG: DUF4167 domain-containing protein [Novosphingobium sp.]|nr:DUF4167 domain-containing protein [Novosphingobium sp.]